MKNQPKDFWLGLIRALASEKKKKKKKNYFKFSDIALFILLTYFTIHPIF